MALEVTRYINGQQVTINELKNTVIDNERFMEVIKNIDNDFLQKSNGN